MSDTNTAAAAVDGTAWRARREAAQLSQVAVARRSGLSINTVRAAEYGQRIAPRSAAALDAALTAGAAEAGGA